MEKPGGRKAKGLHVKLTIDTARDGEAPRMATTRAADGEEE